MKCYLILFYINKNVTLKNKDEKIQLINEKKKDNQVIYVRSYL